MSTQIMTPSHTHIQTHYCRALTLTHLATELLNRLPYLILRRDIKVTRSVIHPGHKAVIHPQRHPISLYECTFFHNLARHTERFLNPLRFISPGAPWKVCQSSRAQTRKLIGQTVPMRRWRRWATASQTAVMLPCDTNSISEHVSVTLDRQK